MNFTKYNHLYSSMFEHAYFFVTCLNMY